MRRSLEREERREGGREGGGTGGRAGREKYKIFMFITFFSK